MKGQGNLKFLFAKNIYCLSINIFLFSIKKYRLTFYDDTFNGTLLKI